MLDSRFWMKSISGYQGISGQWISISDYQG